MNLSEAEQSVWHHTLAAHGRVVARIDGDLVGECDMTLAEYEVLAALALTAAEDRLRMNELADLARLSPSGLTRRFDALVRRGWVERERCDDDRRGVYARITAAGRARLDAARPVHDRGVRTYFLELIDADDLDRVDRVMSTVAEANATRQSVRS